MESENNQSPGAAGVEGRTDTYTDRRTGRQIGRQSGRNGGRAQVFVWLWG